MFTTPSQPLPLDPYWSSPEQYVDSLLLFVTETDLFRNLCGGIHVLDFLTRVPDLYSWVLPAQWRAWFEVVDIHDFLDLLLREDINQFTNVSAAAYGSWRGGPTPPASLVDYIRQVRLHSLVRNFQPVASDIQSLPVHIAVGMKPKKAHEVKNFAAYVDKLSDVISESTDTPISIIDFGSGQNYLGRTLACPPYNKHVVAIEQRHHNVEGAKGMDVLAKLSKKDKVLRNKKEYRRQLTSMNGPEALSTPPPEMSDVAQSIDTPAESGALTPVVETVSDVMEAASESAKNSDDVSKGSMTYIEHILESGHLDHILHQKDTARTNHDSSCPPTDQKSLVVSIHSCGNLTHHGIRSLTLNPSVQAVAMIGCCYNLLTERLGPATYKHPQLRPNHPRLEATGSTYDPHGFPMSHRLETFEYNVQIPTPTPTTPTSKDSTVTKVRERGVRLNITARMMAVQAPYNWGRADSENYFTRHFYRALLQRILLDRGVVKHATATTANSHLSPNADGNSLSGKDAQGTPLIIGSLRKTAFVSFRTYVRAALEKLTTGNPDQQEAKVIKDLTVDLTGDDGGRVIDEYERTYGHARKKLAVIWSLMAFSAGVVESVIVVDRWLWLKEQSEVETAWVETVFGYDLSPRNLCVVGVKKKGSNVNGQDTTSG